MSTDQTHNTDERSYDVIHKLVLTRPEGESFRVPVGSKLVSVGADPYGQGPAVWFRRYAPPPSGDPGSPEMRWELAFRGTGHSFPPYWVFLGTCVQGAFAFHVFDALGNVAR